MTIVVVVMLCLIAYQGVMFILTQNSYKRQIDTLHEVHRVERKELTDRIHSTNFGEYKSAEIKMERVKQKVEDEQPQYELL